MESYFKTSCIQVKVKIACDYCLEIKKGTFLRPYELLKFPDMFKVLCWNCYGGLKK